MASFQVATEALTAASAAVVRGGLDVGSSHSVLSAASGALDGTPAAFAFAEFVANANSTTQTLDTATSELSRALNEAAMAYQLADGASASALRVKGP